MLYIGNMVYPRELDSDCEATREEMERLYGVIIGVSYNEQEYDVAWLDINTHREAQFDHGLKNAWWEEDELTTDQDEYNELVNQEMTPAYEMIDDKDLNKDADYLMEEMESRIQDYAEDYWEEDNYGRDEDIKEEYRKEILSRVLKKIQKELLE